LEELTIAEHVKSNSVTSKTNEQCGILNETPKLLLVVITGYTLCKKTSEILFSSMGRAGLLGTAWLFKTLPSSSRQLLSFDTPQSYVTGKVPSKLRGCAAAQ
jgi:hypothetical protein